MNLQHSNAFGQSAPRSTPATNDEARGQAVPEDSNDQKRTQQEAIAESTAMGGQQRGSAPHVLGDWQRLGSGFSIRFVLRGGSLDADWTPRLPTRREFSRLSDGYRQARAHFMAVVARHIGGGVVCIEVKGPSPLASHGKPPRA